mgnify:FL=1
MSSFFMYYEYSMKIVQILFYTTPMALLTAAPQAASSW